MKTGNISLFSRKALSLILAIALVLVSLTGALSFGGLTASAASTSSTIADVFHDPSIYFMSNTEPEAGEALTLRIRAPKGMLSTAKIQYYVEANGNWSSDVAMTKCSSSFDNTGAFEYWEGTFTTPNTAFYYRFKVTNSTGTRYVGSVSSNTLSFISSSAFAYTSGWYVLPGFSTPDWSKGSSWYAVMQDAFFNGDTLSDKMQQGTNTPDRAWKLPHLALTDRYGGDFAGVQSKIAYIKSLGVDGVYLHPSASSTQNGGYGATDHSQIETSFGNAIEYGDLINALHDNDLRVMQDVVLYFVTSNSIYWNSSMYPTVGASGYNTASPYYSMFVNSTMGHATEEWGGYVINLWDPLSQSMIFSESTSPLQRWADKDQGFGVDGYRFDVGGNLWGYDTATGTAHGSVDVMAEIRKKVKAVSEDVVLLSEWSGTADMRSGSWDARWHDFNNRGIADYINGNTANFFADIGWRIYELPRNTALSSHFQIDDHDYSANYSTPENQYRIRSMRLIQMTMLGSPFVFYGEETNFANGRNVGGFNCFDWDESHWDIDMQNFYKACFELRKQYDCVRDGAFIVLSTSADYYSYARFNETGSVITLTNNQTSAHSISLDLTKAGVASGTVLTDWFTGKTYTASGTSTSISVPAGGTILVTGNAHSSLAGKLFAEELGSASGSVNDNLVILSGGSDVTDTYYSNGSVSVAASSEALLSNIAYDPNGSFTLTADVTFTSAATGTNNDHVVGLSFGTCVKNGATYKMGSVYRPDLSGGSQLNTALVKGTGDANSTWLKVWGGGSVTRGASNSTTLKLNYNNGVVTVFNDSNGSTTGVDFKAQADIGNITDQLSVYNYGLPFTLSNITLSGDVWATATGDCTTNGTTQTATATGASVTGTADQMRFYGRPVFDNASYETTVTNNAGKAAVAFRNTLAADDMAYTVVLDGSNVKVYARLAPGAAATLITTASGYSNPKVKIERDGTNHFTTYLNDSKLSGSDCYVSMGDKIYAGFAALNGTVSFASSTVTTDGRALSDDFSGSTLGSLLGGTTYGVSLDSGKLTLAGNHELTTRTEEADWTFKTKMTYSPVSNGNYAGVICRQDANNFIVAGRMMVDGVKKLGIGKGVGGEFVLEYCVDDPKPNSDVTVQLQRIGSVYSFVYSYDDGATWAGEDRYVSLNFSEEHPGLVVKGAASASFDYACFGDAVHDAMSTNTPQSPAFDEVAMVGSAMTSAAEWKVYNNAVWEEYTTNANGKKVGVGGFIHPNAKSNAFLNTADKYTDFRAEATLSIQGTSSSSGYVGLFFAKGTEGARPKNTEGYTLTLDAAGVLQFYKKSTLLQTWHPELTDGKIRLVVEVTGKNVKLYAGQDATPLYQAFDEDYVGGYFSVVASNAGCLAENLSLYEMQTASAEMYYYNVSHGDNSVIFRTGDGVFGIRNNGFTNYVMTTRIRLNVMDASKDAHAGILLGTGMGVGLNSPDAGLYLNLNKNGVLSFKENGQTLASQNIGTTTAQIMVTKQNKTYRVYVNGGATPVLTYADAYERGGAYTAVSTNSRTFMSEINVSNLQPGENIADNELYDIWMLDACYERSKPYTENFSDASVLDQYSTPWAVTGGVLQSTNDTSWEAQTFYTGSTYRDFILEFKMNRTGGNYAGVSFNKISTYDAMKDSGYVLAVYSNTITLFYANGTTQDVVYSTSTDHGYTIMTSSNRWYTYRVECVGNNIKLYQDGNLMFDVNDDHYRDQEGFIGFRTGASSAQFDDVIITPLCRRTAPVYDSETDLDIVPGLSMTLNGNKETLSDPIELWSNDSVRFGKMLTSSDLPYIVTASVQQDGSSSAGYVDAVLGTATIGNTTGTLAVRLFPNAEGSTTGKVSPNAKLIFNGSQVLSTWTIATNINPSSNATYEFAAEYSHGKLTAWYNDRVLFGNRVLISDYGITSLVHGLGFDASGIGAYISDLHVFGGAQLEAGMLDVTNLILIGDGAKDYSNAYARTGTTEITTGKAYVQNMQFDDQATWGATFTFNSGSYTTASYQMGFLLGTGKIGGVSKELRAVIAQRTKTLYLLADDTTLASRVLTGIPAGGMGDNIFLDDDNGLPYSDPTLFTSYNELSLAVSAVEGIIALTVNTDGLGTQLTANLANLGVTEFVLKPGFCADGITVSLSDLDMSAKIGEYITLDPATLSSANGAVTLYDMDVENGTAKVHVEAADGYQLQAGTLVYTMTDGTVKKVINRVDDGDANDFVLYYDHDTVAVSAAYQAQSEYSISEDTLGTSVHFSDGDSGRIDGVRFLSRIYMPIGEQNPQDDVLTVNYGGVAYTVEDYGALIVPTFVIAKKGMTTADLTLDKMEALTAASVSAKLGNVYYVGGDYLDFTLVMMAPKPDATVIDTDAYYKKYYAREYAMRSYTVLTPVGGGASVTIYGDIFTDSMNAVMARMEG